MKNKLELKSIPDDELLRRVPELLKNSRHVEAELIAHLAEVDARRLYAPRASSLFTYCRDILHMSEHESFLRMTVARASRKHPVLLEMLADGRLHLSGIKVLASHLNEVNRDTLLSRAACKTKREIEELVVEFFPKPDVPSKIRKLPERRKKEKPEWTAQLGPDLVSSTESYSTREGLEAIKETSPLPKPSPAKPAEVKPLSLERYKVTFTASAGLRDKLERLKALMRSAVPDGDLAVVIEEAVTEKLEKLEAKRYGKAKTPRKSLERTDTSASSRYIPAAVKRTVYDRDEGRCRYKDETGRRCNETKRLEFHHVHPYGRGGDHSPSNIEIRCRVHNVLDAERDYGKEVMDRYRRSGSRVSEPTAVYTFSNRATSVYGVFYSLKLPWSASATPRVRKVP